MVGFSSSKPYFINMYASSKKKLLNRFFLFLFLSIILFSAYSNTFHASWHLDDAPNIVNNYYLHLDSLHPHKLLKTFFTNPHHPEQLNSKPYRPISCFSFALNWYVGQDNVFGYHIVNISIHILAAFFLFFFVLKLFHTPNLKSNYGCNPVFVAFLACLLWAANPIQTQAVTYIVQRMAQLAALFYLLGMFSYLKARLSVSTKSCVFWFLSCFLFYLLGIFSKPNAAMLPIALLLLELAFFQDLTDQKTRRRALLLFLCVAILVLLAGSALFLRGDPFSFLGGYENRNFSLVERLFAQPRVLLFYLSQIFYPSPDRLSIAHDIVLSPSLLKPWTTLPSILFIFFLIGFSLYQIKKMPVLSFAILFFFLNHVIESSVIPLEIIFEHRNYLPSLFLFLPVAYYLNRLLLFYKNKNKAIHVLIILFIVSISAFFSVSTYIRNQAWQSDLTLWHDAVDKAPKNARPSYLLGVKLGWGDNSSHPAKYDMALKLFKASLQKHFSSKYKEAGVYDNIALLYFYKKNDPEKAFEYFEKAVAVQPEYLKVRRHFVQALILERKFDTALRHVNILLQKNDENGIYHNLKGSILLWQGKPEAALPCFKEAYELMDKKTGVIFNFAVALSLSGQHEKAEELILSAGKPLPKALSLYFVLIENCVRADNKEKALEYVKKMSQRFSEQAIRDGLETYTDNPKYAPILRQHIAPVISELLEIR